MFTCAVQEKMQSLTASSDGSYIIGGSVSGKLYIWLVCYWFMVCLRLLLRDQLEYCYVYGKAIIVRSVQCALLVIMHFLYLQAMMHLFMCGMSCSTLYQCSIHDCINITADY